MRSAECKCSTYTTHYLFNAMTYFLRTTLLINAFADSLEDCQASLPLNVPLLPASHACDKLLSTVSSEPKNVAVTPKLVSKHAAAPSHI